MNVARPYRFFWPADGDAVLDVLGAARGLTDAGGAEGDRSHGRVTSVEGYSRRTGKPERNGLYCARIFGPTEDHSCLCGKFRGAAHDGVVCDKCGVVCGRAEARQQRFGHLESPVGLLHPRLRAAVAEVLGWSEEAVLGVFLGTWALRGGEPAPIGDDWRDDGYDDEPSTFERCGSAVLHERLRLADHEAWQSRLAAEGYTLTDLLVTRIPVLPAAEREPRVVASPDVTVAKPPRVPDPVNRAYEKLLTRLNRLERLIELNAPPIILRNDERMTQQAFDALCETIVSPPDGDPSVWEPGTPMPTQIELRRPGALTAEKEDLYSWRDEPPALRLIWRGADELLIQQGQSLAITSPSDGAVLHTVELPRFVMATLLDRDARHLLLLDEYNQVSETADDEERPTRCWSGLAVYDLLERAFCERYPETLTQTSLQHDEPEDGWLVKARTGEHLVVMEQADRPTLNAYTRDGRFIWVSDGMDEGEVIDTESGLVHLTTCGANQTPSIWLQEDGSVVVTDEQSDDERDALEDAWNEARDDSDLAHSAAIGRSAAGLWCWLDTDGDLFCPEPRFRLAFPFAASAFDPQLERLAIATADEVLVISLGAVPTVVSRWPLPPFDPPDRS